jgi:hypothetical protein
MVTPTIAVDWTVIAGVLQEQEIVDANGLPNPIFK